jgi:hypothetical protein
MKNTIKFRVMSSQGDTTYEMAPTAALNKIKEIAAKEDKWVYLDGKLANTDIVTTEDLSCSNRIIIGGSLVGGAENYNIVFEVSETFGYADEAVASITLKENPDVIDIKVPKDKLKEIFIWRSTIYAGMQKGLEKLTMDEYDKVMDTIGEPPAMPMAKTSACGCVEEKVVKAIKPDTNLLVFLYPTTKTVKIKVKEEAMYDVFNARKHILFAFRAQIEGISQHTKEQMHTALRLR